MTISTLAVNGDEEEDRMATKSTKGTEVKSDEDGTIPGDHFAEPFAENPLVIEVNAGLVL